MGKKEENTEDEHKAIYAPMEEINCIERVIANLVTTREELQKVADGMIVMNNS